MSLRKKVRALLGSRPGWRVAGEAVNGLDAVKKAEVLRPDVTIVDYGMPELDGISAIQKILSASPHTEVVILTIHDAQFSVRRCCKCRGGYVVKSQIMEDLMPAVEAASEHRSFLSLLDVEQGGAAG